LGRKTTSLSRFEGPFELVDHTGRTVTDADVITMPSIIYFGYTFCPDVCPLDNARNALASRCWKIAATIVQPVFISVDPRRDTPEVLAEFASHLSSAHDRPDRQRRRRCARPRAPIAPSSGPDAGTISTSSIIPPSAIWSPGHGFVEFFRRLDDRAPTNGRTCPLALRHRDQIDRRI
jgi:protein SCO1